MVDFKRITDRAKDLVEKRGGTDSLKQDAGQLKEIAKGQGSFSEKAKAAVEAIKNPGGEATAEAAPAAPEARAPSGAEKSRASEKVKGEGRGKQRHAGEGQGRGRKGGSRRRGQGGGDGDPAV